ncbi:hypothetical protein HYV11_02230 [Candidatus Dependentiae bacterium]|nr:hypothetical protein [Candidatus Dependentiae bacterium]
MNSFYQHLLFLLCISSLYAPEEKLLLLQPETPTHESKIVEQSKQKKELQTQQQEKENLFKKSHLESSRSTDSLSSLESKDSKTEDHSSLPKIKIESPIIPIDKLPSQHSFSEKMDPTRSLLRLIHSYEKEYKKTDIERKIKEKDDQLNTYAHANYNAEESIDPINEELTLLTLKSFHKNQRMMEELFRLIETSLQQSARPSFIKSKINEVKQRLTSDMLLDQDDKNRFLKELSALDHEYNRLLVQTSHHQDSTALLDTIEQYEYDYKKNDLNARIKAKEKEIEKLDENLDVESAINERVLLIDLQNSQMIEKRMTALFQSIKQTIKSNSVTFLSKNSLLIQINAVKAYIKNLTLLDHDQNNFLDDLEIIEKKVKQLPLSKKKTTLHQKA